MDHCQNTALEVAVGYGYPRDFSTGRADTRKEGPCCTVQSKALLFESVGKTRSASIACFWYTVCKSATTDNIMGKGKIRCPFLPQKKRKNRRPIIHWQN